MSFTRYTDLLEQCRYGRFIGGISHSIPAKRLKFNHSIHAKRLGLIVLDGCLVSRVDLFETVREGLYWAELALNQVE